eukprot:44788-Pelagomonas_calceolata.AAC.1
MSLKRPGQGPKGLAYEVSILKFLRDGMNSKWEEKCKWGFLLSCKRVRWESMHHTKLARAPNEDLLACEAICLRHF